MAMANSIHMSIRLVNNVNISGLHKRATLFRQICIDVQKSRISTLNITAHKDNISELYSNNLHKPVLGCLKNQPQKLELFHIAPLVKYLVRTFHQSSVRRCQGNIHPNLTTHGQTLLSHCIRKRLNETIAGRGTTRCVVVHDAVFGSGRGERLGCHGNGACVVRRYSDQVDEMEAWEHFVNYDKLSEMDIKIHHRHITALKAGKLMYTDPATGYSVMTRLSHLQRGECCGNACRHCPFGQVSVEAKKRKKFNSAFYV